MIGLINAVVERGPDNSLQKRFKKACQGDNDSFWALIEPYSGLIYSVAFGIMKNHEQSQDILHEVYIRSFKSLSNLRNPNRLTSWLYTMTRNICYDILRKNIRIDKGKAQVVDAQPKVVSIHEVLIKEEDLKQLQVALEKLPEPFRVILGMKYMNHFSCKYIADILDISVEAVKSRLFEARKLLLAKIQEMRKQPKSFQNGGIIK